MLTFLGKIILLWLYSRMSFFLADAWCLGMKYHNVCNLFEKGLTEKKNEKKDKDNACVTKC